MVIAPDWSWLTNVAGPLAEEPHPDSSATAVSTAVSDLMTFLMMSP